MTCGLAETLSQLLGQDMESNPMAAKMKQPDICRVPDRDFQDSFYAVPDLPMWLRALDDGGISAMSGYILSEGQYRWFCNERWAHSYMDQKEAHDILEREGLLPWYFMSG